MIVPGELRSSEDGNQGVFAGSQSFRSHRERALPGFAGHFLQLDTKVTDVTRWKSMCMSHIPFM